jgi:hypothetical protein
MRKAIDVVKLDGLFRLSGDEDCGVGLDCRECDRGGAPVAYYLGISDAYANDADVEVVETIAGLTAAAEWHAHEVHGRSLVFDA